MNPINQENEWKKAIKRLHSQALDMDPTDRPGRRNAELDFEKLVEGRKAMKATLDTSIAKMSAGVKAGAYKPRSESERPINLR